MESLFTDSVQEVAVTYPCSGVFTLPAWSRGIGSPVALPTGAVGAVLNIRGVLGVTAARLQSLVDGNGQAAYPVALLCNQPQMAGAMAYALHAAQAGLMRRVFEDADAASSWALAQGRRLAAAQGA